MIYRLKDIAIGQKGRVAGFIPGDKTYRKRLLAMGLTPGVEFTMLRCAPLGDPVEIEIRDYSLSLRKAEAESLVIERL
ncbi:MAG: ferrous iron transport protein A [Gammaproteobacteria bacterium]|nr:ferrous iron transport protein A [Gammaproteobacteria bacterium]